MSSKNNGEPIDVHVLYGAPVSLYSGKARAFLRKHATFDWHERLPTCTRYREIIVPAISRAIIPVLETPSGRLIQDTTDIIDFVESEGLARGSVLPSGPVRHSFALVLEAFGDESLLRQAMHYRWNFLDTNRAFLTDQFAAIYGLGTSEAINSGIEQASNAMEKMSRTLKPLGIYQDTVREIETVFEVLLDALQAHFQRHPYLLGEGPTIADYGVLGPFYAHIARDPYPSNMLKQRAPQAYRWVERMMAPDLDVPEFGNLRPDSDNSQDVVPDTLSPIFKLIRRYYLPEIQAVTAAVDRWARDNDPEAASPVHPKPEVRGLGWVDFEYGDINMRSVMRPYLLYMHQRLIDYFDSLKANNQERVRVAFAEAGIDGLLNQRSERRIERANNIEVWGEKPLLSPGE